jgi:rod shape-determining protein MreC
VAVSRRITGHRPKVILIALVLLSAVSLASGARGRAVSDGVRTIIGVVSLPFLAAFSRVEDAYRYTTGLMTNYSDVRGENLAMSVQIAQLEQRVASVSELDSENRRLRKMLAFQRQHPEFTIVPAEVIQHARGVLTVDRGTFHGIKESMCVISPDGVIGMVSQAGPLTSSVATLQSPECRVDAMIKWNRVRGRVFGSGSDLSALCIINYIDLADQVREGDEVVASPDSVFPPGYLVGRVVGQPKRGQLSQWASVMPAADPFRIDEVFILLSANVDLRQYVTTDAKKTEAAALVDTRTAQERLAP